jgi:xylitol oxidase
MAECKNWAGNIEYSSERVFSAETLEQVREFVKQQSRLKVLGTRHCFNTIADSEHGFLSLKSMDKVLALDPVARTVTVGAGMTYGRLAPEINRQGFALHNLASLPHISVAGSCGTATHGSGEKNGNLATAVAGLQIVTAAGDIVELSRAQDGETFRGAVVGLGALGVVTSVTLDIEPSFAMRQYVYENMPMTKLATNFDAIQSSAYSVSLFTGWRNHRIDEIWIKSRVDKAPVFGVPAEFFGAKPTAQNRHPIAGISAENCTQQMGVPGPWYKRLPHFRMEYMPSAGKELQAEYFVPRRNGVEAILAVERLRDQVSPHLRISEIRTIAADDLWMSPCYKQDCVAIHFTWNQDWPAVSQLLLLIERELAPFRARPHWGKLFATAPAELKSIYERMPDFIELSEEFDPQGKFRNEFLSKNIFST